ncbi:MAG: hypothetical protein QG673_388 [Pseudomonadota bacterium]|nr:hypothetical protein [Pseudomonadota bacterium]
MLNQYKILSSTYSDQLIEFSEKIIKHNLLFDASKYIDFACKNMEKTLYKTFIVELKQTNNFEMTLFNIKNIINTKYDGINFLIKSQLNTYLSSYINVTNDIYNNIHDIVNNITEEKNSILTIEPCGDLHNNKFVCKIDYLNKSYYYKPRNADLEQKFIQIIELLNPKLNYIFTPFLEISNHYTIIEHLTFSIHSNLNEMHISLENQALNYYVLSVLCLLGARDMHYGNFLQLGDIIYPIDFETLLSPIISEIREYNQYTVLSSLIFPTISNSGVDFSLFGFNMQEHREIDFFDIKDLYTDNMDLFVNKKNIFNNKIDINFDLVKFKEIYAITHNEFSQIVKQIVSIFVTESTNTYVRIIFRSTYLYSKLIESISHPSVCSSIESIKKYLYNQLANHNIGTLPIPQNILEQEVEQLVSYNIPKFDCHILSNTLILGNVKHQFTGVNCCDNLSIISNNASFNFNNNILPLVYFCIQKNDPNQQYDKKQIKFYLLNEDCRSHLTKFCGNTQMLGPSYIRNVAKWTVSEIDSSFYGGYFGVLLSSSHLKNKIISFDIISKIISSSNYLNHGFAGIGGALLAYNELENNLEISKLKQLSTFLITNLEQLTITKSNPEYEFLNGVSGTIYGIFFTEMLSVAQKKQYIETFITIIEDKRIKYGISELFTEKLPFPQSGLAHGFSGISLAYLVMHLFYQEEKYFEIVKELIVAENKLMQNFIWPDLRPILSKSDKKGLNAWCTGSIGVILSRLLILKFKNYDCLSSLPIKDIIDAVISGWDKKQLALCHGIISDYEVIKKLEHLYQIKLLDETNEAQFKSKVADFNNDEIIYQPGFMNGMSGLIYYHNSKNRIFLLGL